MNKIKVQSIAVPPTLNQNNNASFVLGRGRFGYRGGRGCRW